MSTKAFISYSHLDKKTLDRLHKHLVMLQRDGLIEIWFDREIRAGDEIDSTIGDKFAQSGLFLALVSPDFLASTYCYEKEMQAAVQRHSDGSMRVVPIIVEPCDWKSSPLSAFKALPKDGKPISLWANENVAMLDIVTEVRKVLTGDVALAELPHSVGSTEPPKRRVRVKRDFDSIDIAEFRDAAFEAIRDYFQSSCAELNQIGDALHARFESISATAFTCTVVNRARREGEAHITVHNQKRKRFGDITYSFSEHAEDNTANGMIDVGADAFEMFLSVSQFGFGMPVTDKKLTAEHVARLMWDNFINRAGIEYD